MRPLGRPGDGPDHHRPERDVGDEAAVHDVDVDAVAAGRLGRPDLLGQPAEVGRQQRRGNLNAHPSTIPRRRLPAGMARPASTAAAGSRLRPGSCSSAKATAPRPQATSRPSGRAPSTSPGCPSLLADRGAEQLQASPRPGWRVGPGQGSTPRACAETSRAGRPKSSSPCCFSRGGASVARASSWGSGDDLTPADAGQGLDQQVRPQRATAAAASEPAVSSSPIGSSRRATTGPVSRPSSTRMMETPVRDLAAG